MMRWVAYALIACVGAVLGHRLFRESPVDPLSWIRPEVVHAQVLEDQPIDPRPSGNLTPPEPGGRARLTFWSQPSYHGPIDPGCVDQLITAGKAGTLEFRLGAGAREELRAELRAIDGSMRDLALIIVAQEDAVKEQLRDDPARTIVLAEPVQEDPRFAEALRVTKETTYEIGTVWSEPSETGATYFVVRWSDWPGLKSLYDDRFALIAQRRERVRSTIERLFERHGNGIFE